MILLVSSQWFIFKISFYYHSKMLIMHVCVCVYIMYTHVLTEECECGYGHATEAMWRSQDNTW